MAGYEPPSIKHCHGHYWEVVTKEICAFNECLRPEFCPAFNETACDCINGYLFNNCNGCCVEEQFCPSKEKSEKCSKDTGTPSPRKCKDKPTNGKISKKSHAHKSIHT